MRRLALVLLAGLVCLCCPRPIRADDLTPPDEEPEKRCFLSGEYMLFWVKPSGLGVPLVTTGPASNPTAGGLADPTTTVLFGANKLDFNPTNGGRLEYDHILLPGMTLAISGFYVGEQLRTFQTSSDANGNPLLLRPFFNVETSNPNAGILVAAPGLFSGLVTIKNDRQLFGAESNLIMGLYGSDWWELSYSVGTRYLQLHETLSIQDQSTLLQNALATFGGPANLLAMGDTIFSIDQFATRNQFVGGQLGLFAEVNLSRLYEECKLTGLWLGVGGKLAVGDNHREVVIAGQSTVSSSVIPTETFPIGTLALPTNSGHFSTDGLSAVLEADLKLGYDVTRNLRVTAGYDYLNWSNVVRAPEIVPAQISSNQLPVDPAFGVPGQPVPQPRFRTSSIWVQGVSLGLECRF